MQDLRSKGASRHPTFGTYLMEKSTRGCVKRFSYGMGEYMLGLGLENLMGWRDGEKRHTSVIE